MKRYAIVVAGGKGLRMQSQLPKQFLEIAGKPILIHTIEAFQNALTDIEIVLVLNANYFDHWETLSKKFGIKKIRLVPGGTSRFYSVKNGLSLIDNKESSIIGVHDAVRPLISPSLLQQLYKLAVQHKAVIPTIPLKDSIRKIEKATPDLIAHSNALNRSLYRLIQTPQCFESNLLLQAYQQPYSQQFTDDASVVEASGQQVWLTTGENSNIKITTPEDLVYAEALLQHQQQ